MMRSDIITVTNKNVGMDQALEMTETTKPTRPGMNLKNPS